MSAPPFFQSTGRGDLKFWGKFMGITAGAVVERDGQVEGLGGLVQVEGKRHEEQRPFEVDGKEISSNRSKQTKAKQERRRIRKEARGSQCAGKRGGNRATSNAQ